MQLSSPLIISLLIGAGVGLWLASGLGLINLTSERFVKVTISADASPSVDSLTTLRIA